MEKEIKNLKPWEFVKTKVHDLSGLGDKNPINYLYQLNNGIYYPAINTRDLPKDFKIKFAH
jgi:hypothetical protein